MRITSTTHRRSAGFKPAAGAWVLGAANTTHPLSTSARRFGAVAGAGAITGSPGH